MKKSDVIEILENLIFPQKNGKYDVAIAVSNSAIETAIRLIKMITEVDS